MFALRYSPRVKNILFGYKVMMFVYVCAKIEIPYCSLVFSSYTLHENKQQFENMFGYDGLHNRMKIEKKVLELIAGIASMPLPSPFWL